MTSKRIRWLALLVVSGVILAAVLAYRAFSANSLDPWEHLAVVIAGEQPGFDEKNIQTFGASLAALGRDDEIRETDFIPWYEMPELTVESEKLSLNIVSWREGVEKIAAKHQLVMIDENHLVSKHREMIGATLPLFSDAGFTHYAAEAIGESALVLKRRGYPVSGTGFYTSDPQFGNTLRIALELRFNVFGYDFDFSSHEAREESAASRLAKLFQVDPQTKLLVHAGGGHVLKHETPTGMRWLASILWRKTGVEPFTISQLSSMYNSLEYEPILIAVQEQLGDFTRPVLLMPPPHRDLGLINIADVDAILVHPPDKSVAPSQRTTLFPSEMQRVSGKWLTAMWPVVIAAYRPGEPLTAVPLDQVMLRENEKEFVLWLPASTRYNVVVFDKNGELEISKEDTADSVLVHVIDSVVR